MMKEEQYPKNFIEFLDQFKDEEFCRKYLFELKSENPAFYNHVYYNSLLFAYKLSQCL